MSLNALRCGIAALLGLGVTLFSLSSAQTPVLPDAALAERAIEPTAESVRGPVPESALALTVAPKSAVAAVPAPQAKASVAIVTPVKSITVKTSDSPKRVSTVAAKPSSNLNTVQKSVSVKPVAKLTPKPLLKPTTTVRYVQVSSGRSYVVRSTAYNSLSGQTDSSPHITATGTRTRFGVVALSRDLLRSIPYGSRVRIQDLSGTSYNRMLAGTIFIVEDTMNARMRNKVDVWMSTRSQALNWGSRSIRITVVN